MNMDDILQILGCIYDPMMLDRILNQATAGCFNDQQQAYYENRRRNTPIHSYEVDGVQYDVLPAK